MAKTFEQIYADLKNRRFAPIYLLMGDESYYIDKITQFIADHVLTDDEKSFNQIILYGKDTDATTVDMAARRFPMMSQYQVVIVKEAQDMKKIDDLQFYASAPNTSTILVLAHKHKNYEKRKKLYKNIDEKGVVFESKKLYDNQVPGWIERYLKELNYQITPVACSMLSEYLGNDLSKIANEIDKLRISLKPGSQITPEHIEQNIGISKEFNNFELIAAITQRDILKANRIINYFGQNQKEYPIFVTISSLFGFFSKILIYHFTRDKSDKNLAAVLQVNPYFLKDYHQAAKKFNPKKTVEIIGYLREYDLRCKGVNNANTDPHDLLRELIFKILH